jgi:ABC-2 type transport system permease protein
MPELLRRAVGDRARTLGGWLIGIAAYIALIVAVFPSIHGSKQFDNLLKQYPDVLKSFLGIGDTLSITSGAGFVDTELFSLMLPLLALVLAIGVGAATIAGEEEQGLLELVVSAPVSRRAVIGWKAAGLLVEILAVAVVIVVTLLIGDALVDLGLDTGRLIGATAGICLLALLHGWLAMLVGAATRHRSYAIGVPAAVAAVGYLIAGLYSIADWLDPFRYLSGFYYAGRGALTSGVDWGHLAVLGGASLVVLVAAVAVFERRDLGGA